MINNLLNDNSKVMLLICSDLLKKYNKDSDLKPLTINEWNKLSNKLLNSPMGSPKAFFEIEPSKWKNYIDISDEEVERLNNLLKLSGYLGFELERLSNLGIWITTRAEKIYPSILKKRLKHKSPIVLYCAGDPNILEHQGIAIVGSRNIDEKAKIFTENLAIKCVKENLTVISGGARGVDTIAQNMALSAGGQVISVLSDNMGSYIKKREIRELIIKNKLFILSPFHPDTTFKVYNAMERNKYIYALSELAVVVSSDYKKGGTWAGAFENLRNSWVPLYVRKDTDIPNGNEELIKLGAIPLESNIVLEQKYILRSLIDQSELKNDKNKIEQLNFFDNVK